MLNEIKMLLGISTTDKDNLLLILINEANDEAKAYCKIADLSGLEGTICQMVVYKYNRLGTEGVDSESYSSVDFDYSSDYPEPIYRSLKSHRRLVV